jgi:hypothetical protein
MKNMDEEKDGGFRVTDKRKFNPDGTPRDQPAEQQAPASVSEQAVAQPEERSPGEKLSGESPSVESPPGNVVSFPGEASRKREQPEPELAPGPSAQPDARTAGDQSDRAAAVKAAARAAEQAYNQTKPNGPSHLPEASFLSLAEMLAGEAAMCLGLAQTPDGGKMPVDLEAARHMIDMLGMLEQKTMGNLTAEESGVLENMLGYLRMQFVGLSRKQ